MEMAPAPHAYRKELLSNQVWQIANFGSKAGFLLILTPWMIVKWGTEGYGLFALASSLLVSMALIDGGVRALTRLKLAEALKNEDDAAFREAFWRGLVTFAFVASAVFLFAIVLGLTGFLQTALKLPAGGSVVLVVTVGLTGFYLLSTLALEPIAARGKLSLLKAANTVGAVAAIPVCALALWFNGSVLLVTVLYSLCSILPGLVLAYQERLYAIRPPKGFRFSDAKVVIHTLRSGAWFYMTTVALILKTHALTFVVAAIAGPAEAGIFYILLRFTEIIGNVGATASETSLASLASATSPRAIAENFRQSWLYVAIFSLYGAVGLICLGRELLNFWLPKDYLLPDGVLAAMALFGLTGAFSRVVVNASMGLNIVKSGAIANLVEAVVDIGLAVVGYHLAGLTGVLLGGSLGVFVLMPQARRIAGLGDLSFGKTYVQPLLKLIPGLVISTVILAFANMSSQPVVWLLASGLTGIVAVWELRRLHRAPSGL